MNGLITWWIFLEIGAITIDIFAENGKKNDLKKMIAGDILWQE